MAVWKWFSRAPKSISSHELGALYDVLNDMWQEDCKSSTPEQVAAYSQAFRIEDDPEFKKFMKDLDQSFEN